MTTRNSETCPQCGWAFPDGASDGHRCEWCAANCNLRRTVREQQLLLTLLEDEIAALKQEIKNE